MPVPKRSSIERAQGDYNQQSIVLSKSMLQHDQEKDVTSERLSPSQSQSLQTGGYKGNKRRVSFGVIHAIPASTADANEREQSNCESKNSPRQSSDLFNQIHSKENHSGQSNREALLQSHQSMAARNSDKTNESFNLNGEDLIAEPQGVIKYVDEILQKTMDDLLIVK